MTARLKIKKTAWLILAPALFTSCLTSQTAFDFDRSVDFTSLKTYALHDQGLNKLNLNDLDKPRMIHALEDRMERLGFSRSNRPDILVNILVLEKEGTKTSAGWSGGGYIYDYSTLDFCWTTSQWNPNAVVKQVTESTIAIDFINPGTKSLIWHGRFNGFRFDDFKNREERIRAAVDKILAQYPQRRER